MFNFAGTLGVDGVGVGLAAFGFLNPVLAVLIHVTSELIFILNSARLLSRSSKASPVATARETQAIPAARQAAGGIAH
jgi:Cd2+/Zn2+-exporting ATPase/Cu+-exporting ATPase